MYEKIFTNPNIYRIIVPLPDNPLQSLNSYVIKTSNRNLIIDTGFNRPECYDALTTGLFELDIDMEKTDLFLTHLHSDHIGLAPTILPSTSDIYMSEVDYSYLISSDKSYWSATEETFTEEGFPLKETIALRTKNPARKYAPEKQFAAKVLNDGDKLKVGSWEFTGVLTAGHSPGHMCLYLAEKEIIFLGDQILFDITPNITSWYAVDDSLANYLESLEKINKLPISLALPAHRKNNMNVYDRIAEIKNHHQVRLQNIIDILKLENGLTAYEISSRMKWSMRGKDWSEFPISQKWFAVGETLSHLDYLIFKKELTKIKKYNLYRYYNQ